MNHLDRMLFSLCLTLGCFAYSRTYYLWWPFANVLDRADHELPLKLFLWVFVACIVIFPFSRKIEISGGLASKALNGAVKGLLATTIVYFLLALFAVIGAFATELLKTKNFESVAILGFGLVFIPVGVFLYLLPALPYGAVAGVLYASLSGFTKKP